MRLLRFLLVPLLTAAFPVFPAERIFGSFAGDLPFSARSAFFFDLKKLRDTPLCPVFQKSEGASRLLEEEKTLSGRGIDPGFSAGVFFFAEESAGLLLDSSLSPELLTKLRPEDPAVRSVPENVDGHPLFLLGEPSVGGKTGDIPSCAFPGRPGRLLIASFDDLPLLLHGKKGWTPESRASMDVLPAGAALEGILYPDFSGGSEKDVSALWNGAGRIAFAFAWEERDPYPFRGSVFLFPRSPEESGAVRRNVEDLVRSAYASGREKGEIRPEMMFAFQVLPGPGCTELRIRLTESDAKDFIELFAKQLREGVVR